jgi:RNA polymerase sigma-70 factor (ECF subfamily)
MQTPRPDEDLKTIQLRQLKARLEAGDEAAMDELLRACSARLERMARRMLRDFPGVRSHEQTGDVVNAAMPGFMKALKQLPFDSTRKFFGLANRHLKRRLLDMARRYARPGANLPPLSEVGPERIASPADDDDEMECWRALHEAAGKLPAEQCEVFDLRFYQGLDNPQIAELLQVCKKTVNRRYGAALLTLRERLGECPLPGGK